MQITYLAATALSAALFLYYGLRCLFSNGMVAEFQRFGLSRFRRLTGSLEVLGALGLLAGCFIPGLMIAASGGLALLMVLGVAIRFRLRDSLVETAPALVLMLLNLCILGYAMVIATSSEVGT